MDWAAFTGGDDFLGGALWTGGAGFLPFFAAGAVFEIFAEDFLVEVVIPRRIQTFVFCFQKGAFKEADKGRVI